MLKIICFTLAATFASGVAAQNTAPPDPADPNAAVPVRPYESAFKDYRPYVDSDFVRWREANEEMGRLGGHVGHVSGASQSAVRPAEKPPAQSGHGAHK